MSFCYVVLAHTDPEAVLRLVRRVRVLSPASDVVVRYHRLDYIDPARLRAAGAIPLRSPVDVAWGDWSQVEMVLGALAFARAATGAEYITLISGQDYPIRDLAAWEEQLRALDVDVLLDPLPTQAHNFRIRWSVRRLPPTGVDLVDRGARFALNRAGAALNPVAYAHTSGRPRDDRVWLGLSRVTAPPMTVTKCAQWLTARAEAVDELLRRDRRDARARGFFEHVKIPDESYVASLLHDLPGARIAHGQTTAKEFLPGQGSPQWVDPDVLARLRRCSAAPFARKFGPDVSAATLAAADALCRRTPREVQADVVEAGRPTDADTWPATVRARIVA